MSEITIRGAGPEDVPTILRFIRELAEFEREPDAVKATEADLLRDGFGEERRFESRLGFAFYHLISNDLPQWQPEQWCVPVRSS